MPAPTSSPRPKPRPTKKTPRERRYDRGDREAIAAAADARDAKTKEPKFKNIYKELVAGNVYDQKIRQAKRNGNYTPEFLRELNLASGKPENSGLTGIGGFAGIAARVLAARLNATGGAVGSKSLLTGSTLGRLARGLMTITRN